MIDFFNELFRFLTSRKKIWLLPLLMIHLLFTVLIALTSGSALAPFIHTLF